MTQNKKQHHILIIHSKEGSTKAVNRNALELKTNVKTILTQSYQKFTDEFGTHFIGKIYTGAVFFCKISGETAKSQDMHKISAEIEAKMSTDDMNAKTTMNDSFNKSANDMKLQFTVKTFGVGGGGAETAAFSIEDVIEQYKDFCRYTANKVLITGAYKAELIPYSTLPEAYCNHALESDKKLL